jgi:hypothetical protein
MSRGRYRHPARPLFRRRPALPDEPADRHDLSKAEQTQNYKKIVPRDAA